MSRDLYTGKYEEPPHTSCCDEAYGTGVMETEAKLMPIIADLQKRLDAAEKVCELLHADGQQNNLVFYYGSLAWEEALEEWHKQTMPGCGIRHCKGCPDCQGIGHYDGD